MYTKMEKQRKIYVTPITIHITQHTETHLLAGTYIKPGWTDGTHDGGFDAKGFFGEWDENYFSGEWDENYFWTSDIDEGYKKMFDYK